MARDIHYYLDSIHGTTGNRERLWYRPGYDGTRSLGTIPAFGDTIGNADWQPLPPGFLKKQAGGESGYDALPMGIFDPATRSFRFDLLMLYETSNTDLHDVAHYLTDDPVVSRTFVVSDDIADLTAAIDAPNVFTLLSDLGDATLDVEDFEVVFMGVQERQIERGMKVKASEVIIDVKAIDLLRSACTLLTPQHLYDHISGTSYTVVQKRYVYSTAYLSGGKWYLHAYGTPGTGAYQYHWAYQMSDLWVALAYLIQSVMRAMLADEDFGFSFTANGGAVSDGGPTSMLSLYDQNYQDDGANGGDEITGDVMFIGRITMSDTGDTVGGWYHSGSPDGAHRYKTFWDMLKDATEGHCTRARIGVFQTFIIVSFYSLEYEVPGSIPVTSPTAGATQSPTPGREVIVGAESDISDATGADLGHAESQVAGTQEDNIRTIPRWFHCQPFVGPEGEVTNGGEVTYLLKYTGESDFDGVFPGPMVGIAQLTWPVNTMLYLASGIVGTEEVLMRVHHRVKVYTGNLSTPLSDDCSDAITPGLPTALNPDDIASGSDMVEPLRRDQIRDGFWRKYRLSMIATQRTAGVQLAVCAFTARLWSRWTQYGVDIPVPTTVIQNSLGVRCDLDLPSWLSSGDFFDGFDSKPFVTNIKENAEKGSATVTLIAPGVA